MVGNIVDRSLVGFLVKMSCGDSVHAHSVLSGNVLVDSQSCRVKELLVKVFLRL